MRLYHLYSATRSFQLQRIRFKVLVQRRQLATRLLGRPLDLLLSVLTIVPIVLEVLQHLGDVVSHRRREEATPLLLWKLNVCNRFPGTLAHVFRDLFEAIQSCRCAKHLAFVLGKVG